MSEHTVRAYDTELASIRLTLEQMGAVAQKMVVDATHALTTFDAALAQAVVGADPGLDALQREIEERAVQTIARRQPMAIDLRELVGAIRIASDLERVGDLAKNIAKRALVLGDDERIPRLVVGLRHMSDVASLQLHDVLEAFNQRDQARADDVWTRDAELDDLEDAVFRDLLTFMMEDPRNISFCIHLLFCSKNIERIGDHATNVAETLHYIVTGQALPVDRPKGAALAEAHRA